MTTDNCCFGEIGNIYLGLTVAQLRDLNVEALQRNWVDWVWAVVVGTGLLECWKQHSSALIPTPGSSQLEHLVPHTQSFTWGMLELIILKHWINISEIYQ